MVSASSIDKTVTTGGDSLIEVIVGKRRVLSLGRVGESESEVASCGRAEFK
jgi:hypothetical protein